MADYRRVCLEAEFTFASYSALGPDTVLVDPRRLADTRDALASLHHERPFTAVLNRKEKCVIPAAVLAAALGLPPITSAPELARDKFLMRRALNGNASFPRTTLVREPRELDAVAADMFPCVLKPRFGFNSRSAVLAIDRRELEAAYLEHHGRYADLPKQDGTNGDFVVEELITGSEHTVESLIRDGEPLFHFVSDKLPMTPPYFVEIGDTMPSGLSDAGRRLCTGATDRAVRAVGIRNGWTHTEVKLDGERATVVECAARMGGGYFEDLFREVYGIDRMAMLIDLHLGRLSPAPPPPRRHAAARRLVVDGPPRRRMLVNAARLFAEERVMLVWPTALSEIDRELAGPPHTFNNTLCEFIALGATGDEASAVANRIIDEAELLTCEP